MKLLQIYLNDHLAAASAGVDLAKRTAASNRGGELGNFLADLADQIEADRASLVGIMERLALGQDRPKQAAAWAGEKLGRLKMNGQLRGYSPLSRVIELEGLCLGVEGKLSLWRSLQEVLGGDARLDDIDLASLAERATAQRTELERHRLRAVSEALTPA